MGSDARGNQQRMESTLLGVKNKATANAQVDPFDNCHSLLFDSPVPERNDVGEIQLMAGYKIQSHLRHTPIT
jgi:hypothetical protein